MLKRAAIMAGLFVLAACATETASTDTHIPSVITLEAVSLLAGDSITPQVQVTIGGEMRLATPAEVRITSSNTDVVIVTGNNALIAVGDGQSEITISWAATPSVSVTRTVTIVSENLNGVRLTGQATIVSGDSVTLDVTGAIRGGRTITNPVSVTVVSRNPAVVTVSARIAIANAPGQAWIVATASTGLADSLLVSVLAGAPAYLTFTPEIAALVAGQQLQLGAILISDLRGNTITSVTPTYSSTAPAIAIVQTNGVVIGVAAGSAMIVVTAGSAADTLRLTVAPAPLQRLVPTPDSMTLRPGDTARVTVKAFDTQGNQMTLPTLTWSSLTGGITVSSSGLVTASSAIAATISNGAIQVSSGSVSAQAHVAVVVAPPPVLQSLIVTPDSITLSPGGTAQLQVQGMDNFGMMMATVPPVTWQSLSNGITVSSSGVVTAAAGLVSSIFNGTVRVSSGGIFTNVRVVVIVVPAPPPPPPPPPPPSDGGYVQVRWVGTMPSASVVAAFEAARLRINTLFKSFGAIPTVVMAVAPGTCMNGVPGMSEGVPGLVIYAQVTAIDGSGGILGSAGPCYVRSATWLPIVGAMQFDVADMNSMVANGTLNGVVLHEMMHTLGFGVIWGPGPQQQVIAPGSSDPRHNGVNARLEYLGLGAADGLLGVPVENTGGSGTRGSHWRESAFRSELMTGWADGTLPMSRVTVAALKDFGYDVDLSKADAFTLTGSVSGAGLRASQLIVETVLRPIGMVGPDGKISPYNGPQ